jgi:uncharacterized protein involved in exopolysaccharide biosynthesis
MTTDSILFPLSGPPRPPSLTPGEVAAVLRRNVWPIAASVAIVSALAFGVYRLQKPVFVSTARILVQTDQLGTPSFLSGIAAYRESQIAEPVGRKLETEMALITNRASASEVVAALGIDGASLPASPLVRLKALVAPLTQRLGLAEPEPELPAKVVSDFLAALSVEPVRSKTAETTSNVLEIALATTDPALSTRALKGVLETYLRVSTQQNRGLGTETTRLLQAEIAQSKKELKTIEDAMVALAVRESAQPEFASSTTTAALGGTGQARRDAGRNANETATSQLVTQVLDLQGQLDALRENFTEQTESVVRLRQRLGEVRARLATQMRTSATNSSTFNQLERQRAIAQDQYVELRRKLGQIDLYMALTPAALDGRIVVSPPTRPEAENRDGARSKLPLIAGPVAGLLLGLLLAGLRELLQPRVRTRREVERLLGLHMLGALPSMREARPPVHRIESARS